MLAAIVILIGVVVVSKVLRHMLAVVVMSMAVVFASAIAPGTARAADTGAITVDGTVATRYDAYPQGRPLSTMPMPTKRSQLM